MKSWICDGNPKNGKSYLDCLGSHESYQNYGEDCVICSLPKKAVVISEGGNKRNLIIVVILVIIGIGLLGGVGKIIASFLDNSPPPPPCTTPSCYYRTFAEVPNVPNGEIRYGGSTTFAPLRKGSDIFKRLGKLDVVATLDRVYPGFKLRYIHPLTGDPGSGRGIEMLLNNQLSFAESSRPIKKKEFEEAQKRNFNLKEVPVAIDGIVFYVNADLVNQGVKGITLSQVRDIFTGKIRNWKSLGGPDREITPFSRNLQAGGTVDFLFEEVIKKSYSSEVDEEALKKLFTDNVREVEDTTLSIRQVAKTPGGIGYATASEVIDQEGIRLLPLAKDENSRFVSPCADDTCKTINKTDFANGYYPLTRRLFVVIKQDGGLDEQAGFAYANLLLSDEGQQLVEQAGFVPIRK